jgi:hypothetical protein
LKLSQRGSVVVWIEEELLDSIRNRFMARRKAYYQYNVL